MMKSRFLYKGLSVYFYFVFVLSSVLSFLFSENSLKDDVGEQIFSNHKSINYHV